GHLEIGVPGHVSSSSSDQGSKLQGPSQNSPHVASKRDVNIVAKRLTVGVWCKQSNTQDNGE
ncbi:hypothetical protein AVEN_98961-1, partial [Araneus ventricosus]